MYLLDIDADLIFDPSLRMHSAPGFYLPNDFAAGPEIWLDEHTSKHVLQVLRMKPGEEIRLTNGNGLSLRATIQPSSSKKCKVTVIESNIATRPNRKITIGISLLKNTNRFEWFLEKATEIGVNELIPLLCDRTEKQTLRMDRMKSILVSAMLQSQQSWLPAISEPKEFRALVTQCTHQQKFIAHCEEPQPLNLSDLMNSNLSTQIILIGPEGDFTREELAWALSNHFMPVSLGENRLRCETAGVVAAAILKIPS